MSLMVCFNSRDLADMTEPMEVLAASRIWMAFFLFVASLGRCCKKICQLGEMNF